MLYFNHMNKRSLTSILFTITFVSALTATAFAQQPQTINLKDGTSIKGQLTSVANGFYFIDSTTMGRVKISADQILSISNGPAAPAQGQPYITVPGTLDPSGKISADAVNSVKDNMLQDPQIMGLVQELVQDPEIAELMKNPALMQAALTMDPEKIQNNPDVQKLLQNPTMQKIIAVTAQKMQQPAR